MKKHWVFTNDPLINVVSWTLPFGYLSTVSCDALLQWWHMVKILEHDLAQWQEQSHLFQLYEILASYIGSSQTTVSCWWYLARHLSWDISTDHCNTPMKEVLLAPFHGWGNLPKTKLTFKPSTFQHQSPTIPLGCLHKRLVHPQILKCGFSNSKRIFSF